MKERKYKSIVCGGTFDLFHKGHREFLLFGLEKSEKLLLGITSDAYVKQEKLHEVEPYIIRKRAVQEFLQAHNALDRVEIAPLDSVYIPEVWRNQVIDAILVTKDSLPGGEAINAKRHKEKKSPLPILFFLLTQAEDGMTLSSSRIRLGVIDREGALIVNPLWYEKTMLLPPSLRKRFQEPFGEIVDAKTNDFSEDEKNKLIAVGDVTSTILHGRGMLPKLSVVDLLVQRKRQFQNLEDLNLKDTNLTYSARNTPGHISSEVFQRVRDAFSQIEKGKTITLHIFGEEDLTVLPILLHAPLGFVLCYGQPNRGTVKVVVNEEIKKKAKALLQKFTIGN